MKIIVERIHSTFNYGSLMMAVNTLSVLNKNIPNCEFYVDASTEEDLYRLKKETNLSNIYVYRKKKNYSSNKIIHTIKKFFLYRKEFDAVIVLGGDDISEYYGIESLNWKLRNILSNRFFGLKVVLLGQTVGPFTGERIKKARSVLNKVRVYTRDDKCFEYLKSIGIKSGQKGRDLAFLQLPNSGDEIFEKYSLKRETYITMVPSGLYKWYTKDYKQYLDEQMRILRNLLSNNRLQNKKIVLLSHVIQPEHVDDRVVIKDMYNMLSEEEKEKIVPIYDKLLSSEARSILSGGIFTITGRMHAAVSTFFSKKPALSLSYSVKYQGVIGEGLNRSDLIIEAAGDEKWKGTNISDIVKEKVEYILDNYETLIKEINDMVLENIKITENELEDVCDYLNK